ncbi:hypothetical protein BDB01DRAFT_839102 [Pilobolus umbonatus]|nr:hypothetical protein BDB01DRAFT_839102 [Pilobolus umbonatus]
MLSSNSLLSTFIFPYPSTFLFYVFPILALFLAYILYLLYPTSTTVCTPVSSACSVISGTSVSTASPTFNRSNPSVYDSSSPVSVSTLPSIESRPSPMIRPPSIIPPLPHFAKGTISSDMRKRIKVITSLSESEYIMEGIGSSISPLSLPSPSNYLPSPSTYLPSRSTFLHPYPIPYSFNCWSVPINPFLLYFINSLISRYLRRLILCLLSLALIILFFILFFPNHPSVTLVATVTSNEPSPAMPAEMPLLSFMTNI